MPLVNKAKVSAIVILIALLTTLCGISMVPHVGVAADAPLAQAVYNGDFDYDLYGWHTAGDDIDVVPLDWGNGWSYADLSFQIGPTGSIWQQGWGIPVDQIVNFNMSYNGAGQLTIFAYNSVGPCNIVCAMPSLNESNSDPGRNDFNRQIDVAYLLAGFSSDTIIDGVRFDAGENEFGSALGSLQLDWVYVYYTPSTLNPIPAYPVVTDLQTNGGLEGGSDGWTFIGDASRVEKSPHTGQFAAEVTYGSSSVTYTLPEPVISSSLWRAYVFIKCSAYTNTKITLYSTSGSSTQDLWMDSGGEDAWEMLNLRVPIRNLGGNLTAIKFTSDAMTGHTYMVDDLLIQYATFTLTTDTLGDGSVTPLGGSTHLYNSHVSVLASSTNDTLGYWLLNGTNAGTTNPYDVTMTGDYTLTAVFSGAIPTPTPVPANPPSGPGPVVQKTPAPAEVITTTGEGGDALQDFINALSDIFMNPWVWLLLILLLLLTIGMYVYKKYQRSHGYS